MLKERFLEHANQFRPFLDFEIYSTWDNVFRAGKSAIEDYDKKGRGTVRGLGRKLGDYTPILDTWSSLLPNGDYTSIFCGALKMVFEVSGNHK